MRKPALILLLVIAVVIVGMRLLGASAGQPEPTVIVHPASAYLAASERSLNCTRLLAPPVIDGQLSDWPATESIELSRNTAYLFMGRIDSLDDLSAVIRSGWNQQYVYFAIQVTDDVVVADSTDVWRDDGVELGLDGFYDQYPWGWDDHQYSVVVDGRTSDRGMPTSDISIGVLQRDKGYDVEVAVPVAKLIGSEPISGTVMGFTIGLHDDDDGGNWDGYLIWEGTNTSSSPEQFGRLVFTERPEDRIIALEAKLIELERRLQEVYTILKNFQFMKPVE